MFRKSLAVSLISLALMACEGPPGPAGTPGTNGTSGNNGIDGKDGMAGLACWDLDGNGKCDPASEDINKDGSCDIKDCAGAPGAAAPGTLALEKSGLVGFVRNLAGDGVVGATVYLVPITDIPTAPIEMVDIVKARASTVDEPLEDTIAEKGSGYTKATTDADGAYRIPTVPTGAFFVTVIPAETDKGHLPGGSACRLARKSADLVGKQLNIDLSSTPSRKAEFVGASVCLNCHGMVHEKKTLHNLGIRVIGKAGPLQDSSRFPNWNEPLAKFTATGTTLYFFGFNGNTASPDWKVSEQDPGTGVSFTARLRKDAAGKLLVDLTNVAGTPATQTHELELSYGGGLYKQRWMTKVGGSRYVIPIQYNYEGQTNETNSGHGRWRWQHYNAQNWYDETTKAFKTLAKGKSFDNNCAPCHFTGFKLAGDATSGWKASAVEDVNGEHDYDGDGRAELMNLSCESCHGPGSEHWEKAGSGKAIVSPRLLTPEREVTICAQCHTRFNGVGGGVTEAPLDANHRMPMAGISRKEFLTNHVSKMDDGLWPDNKHSKKHHQQASDFMKSKKYRNGDELVTCSSCHDLHGNSGLPHQMLDRLDHTKTGEGLCLSCHEDTFPKGASLAARQQAHWASYNVINSTKNDLGCADCHSTKTAKSGAGRKQLVIGSGATEKTYWSGDISSHVFDVPFKTTIAGKPTGDAMPVPYTDGCGLGCHILAP